MAPLLCSRALLLVGALAITTIAGPIQRGETKCARACPMRSKFGFEQGKTYEYNYVSETRTHMAGGASNEDSSMTLRALLKIGVISSCEFSLKMTRVTLTGNFGSTPTGYSEALQAQSLRFGFSDGTIYEVCPDTEEPEWVLNIKKSILANIQNTMDDLTQDARTREDGLQGYCDIQYEIIQQSPLIVKKIKQINTCTSNMHIHSLLESTPFKSDKHIKASPIFKTTSECTQNYNNNNLLESVTCDEKHQLAPFARGEAGAITHVIVTIEKVETKDGVSAREGPIARRECLTFTHDDDRSPQDSNAAKAEVAQIVTDAGANVDVRPETPGVFLKLVKALQKLDAANLKQVYLASAAGKVRKMFDDAIPYLKTEASLSLIKDQLNNPVATLTGKQADVWVGSLGFNDATPTNAMLAQAKGILEVTIDASLKRDMKPQTVSLSVAGLFYSYCRVNDDCDTNANVQAVVGVFNGRLGSDCGGPEDQVLLTLKAFGNLGQAGSNLVSCLQRSERYLQVAALEAFRRMPCSADENSMFRILEDANTDTELRIKAYLNLIACPSEHIVERIYYMLDTEPINQVGSFITTHLDHLKDTKSPSKQYAQDILEKHFESRFPNKKFPYQRMKYSRNVNYAYHATMLNAGGNVESNIIYSPESFAPRSISLNLTADVYGRSINFLELGGRMEGLENVIQKYFGPELYVTGPNSDQVKGQTFLRVFGTEVSYSDLDWHTLAPDQGDLGSFDFIKRYIGGDITKLHADHTLDYNKNMIIMSSELVQPTAGGMPLRLGLYGAASVRLSVQGKHDFTNALSGNLELDINIQPSASLEMTGDMGVSTGPAQTAQTGLKMVSYIHTSRAIHVKVNMAGGLQAPVFSSDILFPKENFELYNAKTQFYLTQGNSDVELALFPDNVYTSETKCTGDYIEKVTGFALCGDVSYPSGYDKSTAPALAFVGSRSVSVRLEKRDTGMTGFHFEAKVVKDAGKDIALIKFDTPGSRVSRTMSLDFELNKPAKKVKLAYVSPWRSAVITGEVAVTQNPNNVQYTPRFEVAIEGLAPKVVSGNILYRADRRVLAELTTESIFTSEAGLKAEFLAVSNAERTKYSGEISVKSPIFNSKTAGFVTRPKNPEAPYTIDVAMDNNKYPQYDMDFKGSFKSALSTFEGGRTNVPASRFSGRAEITTRNSPYKSEGNADIIYKGVTYTFNNLYEVNGQEYTIQQKFQVDKVDKFKSNVLLKGLIDELNAEIDIVDAGFSNSINFDPIKLTANIKPDMSNFVANFKTKYGSNVYDLKTTAARSNDEVSGMVRAEWPQSGYLQLGFKHADDSQGWWSQSRNMDGYIKITSSLDPIKDVGFTYQDVQSPGQTNIESALWWTASDRIEVKWERKPASIKWDIFTPAALLGQFSPHVQGTLTYDISNNRLQITKNIDWDGKKITVNMNGVLDLASDGHSLSLNTNSAITSPFAGYESMTAEFAFEFDETRTSMTLDAKNAANQKILEFVLGGEKDLSGEPKTISGQVKISLPKSNLIYDVEIYHSRNQYNKMDQYAKVQWAADGEITITHNVTKTGDYNGGQGTMQLNRSVKMTTKFDLLPMLNTDMVYKLNAAAGTRELSYDISLAGNKAISLNADLTLGDPIRRVVTSGPEFLRVRPFDLNARITTPYVILELLKVDITGSKTNGVFKFDAAVAHNDESPKQLIMTLGMEDTKEFSLEIKSPYTAYLEHYRAKFSYTGGLLSLGGNGDLEALLAFSLKPQLPGSYEVALKSKTALPTLHYELSFTDDFPTPKYVVKLEHRKDGAKYLTDFDFNLSPPYTLLSINKKISLSAKHSLEFNLGAQRYHSTNAIKYQYGRYKSPIDYEINIILKPERDIRITLDIPKRSFQFEFTHVGSYETSFTTDLKVIRNEAPIVKINYELKTTSKLITRDLDFMVKTPYQDYETVSVVGHEQHDPEYKDFRGSRVITYGAKSINMNYNVVRNTAANTVSISYDLTTPYEAVRTFTAQIDHQGILQDMSQTFEFVHNGKPYTGNANYKRTKRDLQGALIVNTPDVYKIEFYHKGFNPKNFENSATVTIRGTPYSAATKFKLSRTALIESQVEAEVEVSLPAKGVYKAVFARTSAGEGNRAQQLTISLPQNREYFFQGAYTYIIRGPRPEIFATNLVVRTPHAGYETQGYEIKYDISVGLEILARVTTSKAGFQNQAIRYRRTTRDQGFAVVGALETSHAKLETIEFEINHVREPGAIPKPFTQTGSITHPRHKFKYQAQFAGNIQRFSTGGFVEYNTRKIEVNLASKLISQVGKAEYDLDITIATPYVVLKTARLHLTNSFGARSTGTLKYTRNDIDKLDIDFSGNMGQTSQALITFRQPFVGSFDLTIQSGSDEETATAVLIVGTVQYDIALSTRVLPGGKELSVTVNSPLSGELATKVSYSLSPGEISYNSELTLDGTRYALDINGNKTSNGPRKIYKGEGKLTLGTNTYLVNGVHKYKPNKLLETDLNILGVRLGHTLTLRSGWNDVLSVLKLRNPTINVQLTTTGSFDVDTPNLSLTSVYLNNKNQETFEVYGKVANESPDAQNMLYVIEHYINFPADDTKGKQLFKIYSNPGNVGVETVTTLTSGGADSVYSAKTELDKANKAFVFETQNGVKDISLRLALKKIHEHAQRLELLGEYGGTPVKGELDFCTKTGVDAKLYLGANMNNLKLFSRARAELVTPSHAIVEVYREKAGIRTEHVVLSARMNDTRLMSFRAHLRPGIYDDLKAYYNPAAVKGRLLSVTQAALGVVKGHATKARAMLQPIKNLRLEIQSKIVEQYEFVKAKALALYNNNRFHCRDIIDYVKDQAQAAREGYAAFKAAVRERFQQLKEDFNSQRRARRSVATYYNDLEDRVKARFSELRDSMGNMIKDNIAALKDLQTDVISGETSRQIRQYLNDMELNLDFVDDIADNVAPYTMEMFEGLESSYDSLRGMVDEMLKRPELVDIKDYIEYKIQDFDIAYLKAGYKAAKNMNAGDAKERIRNMVKNIRERVSNYLQLDRTKITFSEMSDSQYEVQGEVYLPFELHNFKTIAKIPLRIRARVAGAVNNIRRMAHYARSQGGLTISDIYYRLKSKMSQGQILPPFSSHASILGKHHFKTFDGKFYDFEAACTFKLMQEVNGRFSISIKYDANKPNTKTFIVEKPGSKSIISIEGGEKQVTGRPFNDYQEGDKYVVDDMEFTGFKLTCDLAYDSCTVELSGWNYNKVSGLLGTNDNEPYTDFRMYAPHQNNQGRIYRDDEVEDFAMSTKKGSCRSTRNVADHHAVDENSACAILFSSDDSPLRPCFKVVKPEPFMGLCGGDAQLCNVAAFYAGECARRGIPLDLPQQC